VLIMIQGPASGSSALIGYAGAGASISHLVLRKRRKEVPNTAELFSPIGSASGRVLRTWAGKSRRRIMKGD
jgi:hypothetical protein